MVGCPSPRNGDELRRSYLARPYQLSVRELVKLKCTDGAYHLFSVVKVCERQKATWVVYVGHCRNNRIQVLWWDGNSAIRGHFA